MIYWHCILKNTFEKKSFSFINIPKILQNYNCLSMIEKYTRYNKGNLKRIFLLLNKNAIEFKF